MKGSGNKRLTTIKEDEVAAPSSPEGSSKGGNDNTHLDPSISISKGGEEKNPGEKR